MLAQIADVVIETYAIESAIARAEKMAARGDGRAALAADIAQGLHERRRRQGCGGVAARSSRRSVRAAPTSTLADGVAAPRRARPASTPSRRVAASPTR